MLASVFFDNTLFEGYIPVLVMVSIDCFTDLDIVILVALWRIIVFLFPV